MGDLNIDSSKILTNEHVTNFADSLLESNYIPINYYTHQNNRK